MCVRGVYFSIQKYFSDNWKFEKHNKSNLASMCVNKVSICVCVYVYEFSAKVDVDRVHKTLSRDNLS